LRCNGVVVQKLVASAVTDLVIRGCGLAKAASELEVFASQHPRISSSAEWVKSFFCFKEINHV
jgi:hypothetical protein